MDEFRLEYVKLESGKCPFIKFLDSVTKKERAEIITMLEEFRLKLSKNEKVPSKISKYVQEGIFEIRIRHIFAITRVFYFFQVGKLIIITHGYIKKSQKTPTEEIEKAIKYRNLYLRSKNETKNKP